MVGAEEVRSGAGLFVFWSVGIAPFLTKANRVFEVGVVCTDPNKPPPASFVERAFTDLFCKSLLDLFNLNFQFFDALFQASSRYPYISLYYLTMPSVP
ncbi:MAG TPA: hypothetical protein VFA07_12440 [Chthonomonadaceae bacterium]|nr:hypothetical protein [Chthonomonadaceae bacterium]